MLFITLLAVIAAGVAKAQLPDVPKCSLNCFANALTTDGCSSLADFACHCQKPSLISTVTPCVEKACEIADQIAVSKAVVYQCSAAGYPISVPAVETTTSASSGTITSTASETTSSASKTSASVSSSTTTITTTTSSSSTGSSTIISSSNTTSTSMSSSSTSAAESTTSCTAVTQTSPAPHGASSAGGTSFIPNKTSTPLPSKTHGNSTASATSTFNAAGNIKGNMAGVAVVAAAAVCIL